MEKGLWFGVVFGLMITFVIFIAGFYSGNNITGDAVFNLFSRSTEGGSSCASSGTQYNLEVGKIKKTIDTQEDLEVIEIFPIEKKAILKIGDDENEVALGSTLIRKDAVLTLDKIEKNSIIIRINKIGKIIDINPNIPYKLPNAVYSPNVVNISCNDISPRTIPGNIIDNNAGAGNIRAVSPGQAVQAGGYITKKTGHEWCDQEGYNFCSQIFEIPLNLNYEQIWKCTTDVTCDQNANCWVTDNFGRMHTVNIKCCNNNI